MIYNGGAIKELESTKERPPLADILEGMGGVTANMVSNGNRPRYPKQK